MCTLHLHDLRISRSPHKLQTPKKKKRTGRIVFIYYFFAIFSTRFVFAYNFLSSVSNHFDSPFDFFFCFHLILFFPLPLACNFVHIINLIKCCGTTRANREKLKTTENKMNEMCQFMTRIKLHMYKQNGKSRLYALTRFHAKLLFACFFFLLHFMW